MKKLLAFYVQILKEANIEYIVKKTDSNIFWVKFQYSNK